MKVIWGAHTVIYVKTIHSTTSLKCIAASNFFKSMGSESFDFEEIPINQRGQMKLIIKLL